MTNGNAARRTRRPADRLRAAARGAPDRPDVVFDPGIQQERTSLAWERSAVSIMASGVLLASYAAQTRHFLVGILALGIVVFGSAVLVWSALHYEDLHGTLRDGVNPTFPTATRILGLGSIVVCATAMVIAFFVLAA